MTRTRLVAIATATALTCAPVTALAHNTVTAPEVPHENTSSYQLKEAFMDLVASIYGPLFGEDESSRTLGSSAFTAIPVYLSSTLLEIAAIGEYVLSSGNIQYLSGSDAE